MAESRWQGERRGLPVAGFSVAAALRRGEAVEGRERGEEVDDDREQGGGGEKESPGRGRDIWRRIGAAGPAVPRREGLPREGRLEGCGEEVLPVGRRRKTRQGGLRTLHR